MATETLFTIPTDDGAVIHGILNRGDAPADKAVILSHGLTGFPQEHLHQSARRHFVRAGYDVIRFYYYCELEKARHFSNCTLALHAADLNTVTNHFRPAYKKLYIAGHSYGGLAALMADPAAEAISFWDSSFLPYDSFWKSEAVFVPALDCYKMNWGWDILVGKRMVEEARDLIFDRVAGLALNLRAPGQVILAASSATNNKSQLYDALPAPKDFHIVPGSSHTFPEQDVVDDLLQATGRWFGGF